MKKMFGMAAFCALLFGFSSNAQADPVFGIIYKNATHTGEVLTSVQPLKTGSATCTSYFALIARGNCGIGDAARAGKIRNVAFYDTHVKNILGYQKITTKVYGQ